MKDNIKYKIILKKITTNTIVLLFYVVDVFIWLLINIMPSKLIIKIFTERKAFYNILRVYKSYFISKIILAFKKRECNSFLFTSCLSRSITTKLFFNFVGRKINLNLGFTKLDNGTKEPHAWLSDPLTGKNIFKNKLNKDQVKLITYK